MNRAGSLVLLAACVAVIVEYHWWGVLALWIGASVVLGLCMVSGIAVAEHERPRYVRNDARFADEEDRPVTFSTPIGGAAYSDSCTCPGCGALVLVGSPSGPVVVPLGHEVIGGTGTLTGPLSVTFSCPARKVTVTLNLVDAAGSTGEPLPTFLDDGTGRLICATHAVPTGGGRFTAAPALGCAACAQFDA